MRSLRRATIFLSGWCGLFALAEAGELPRPSTNDFLLRAPAAVVEQVAGELGLQIVSGVPASADGQGRPVYLLRAADGASPEAILDALRQREPQLLNAERALVATVPESGAEADLKQRTRAILGALQTPGSVPFGTDLDPGRTVWSSYVNQPAAVQLRLPEANASFRGAGIVAIIDTGIDPDHPLLRDVLVPGYDFTRDTAGGSEWEDLLDQRTRAILGQSTLTVLGTEQAVELAGSTSVILAAEGAQALDPATVPPAFGHGTMVAGIVHRAAPQARIMPLKTFQADGSAHIYDIVRAIYYAVDHGAQVINMSFSVDGYSPELMRAVNYAARKGVVCVTAAGNEGEESLVYPAALGTAIGVASTDAVDHLSRFSNHGDDLVTVAAPGENLVTAYPGGGWALVSGTSFSAPWVSGAVALFIDKNDGEQRLDRANYSIAVDALSRSLPVHGFGHVRSGHGRIDVKLALEGLEKP